MWAYLSKFEKSCFHAMKKALKISIQTKFSCYGQMKTITQAYASNWKWSVQEAICHYLPEL